MTSSPPDDTPKGPRLAAFARWAAAVADSGTAPDLPVGDTPAAPSPQATNDSNAFPNKRSRPNIDPDHHHRNRNNGIDIGDDDEDDDDDDTHLAFLSQVALDQAAGVVDNQNTANLGNSSHTHQPEPRLPQPTCTPSDPIMIESTQDNPPNNAAPLSITDPDHLLSTDHAEAWMRQLPSLSQQELRSQFNDICSLLTQKLASFQDLIDQSQKFYADLSTELESHRSSASDYSNWLHNQRQMLHDRFKFIHNVGSGKGAASGRLTDSVSHSQLQPKQQTTPPHPSPPTSVMDWNTPQPPSD